MIFFFIRVIIVLAILVFIGVVVYKLFRPAGNKICPRCEGNGFWHGTRGKETCDWCKGSGIMPSEN